MPPQLVETARRLRGMCGDNTEKERHENDREEW